MKNTFGFLKNPWFKFIFWGFLYLLLVIWMQNLWLLPGLIIIFDYHITKKVNWTFWKKRKPKGYKYSTVTEWVDALIFAVVVAYFIRMFFVELYVIPTPSMEKSLLVGDYLLVGKYNYGTRMPNTPLAIPFMHNTIPGTDSKSYSELIKNPYKRLAGLEKIKNNDIVVFNFPEGDTVALKNSNQSYYQIIRTIGRKTVWDNPNEYGKVISRPVDKRDNYIKRCVAIPGDELQIKQGVLYINGEINHMYNGIQNRYIIRFKQGQTVPLHDLQKLGVEDANALKDASGIVATLSEEQRAKITKIPAVEKIDIYYKSLDSYDPAIFPHDAKYMWNHDNFGPLKIPAKGKTVSLSQDNISIYRRIISVYEANTLEERDGKIFINGEEASSYTFKMDYYWMMGDNRNNSLDSRYWGFVPEDHVVGKALMVVFSKSARDGIRFKRIMKVIHNMD
ncbi:MAG: signal peptidase I [Bacteroidales bacterium]